MEHHFEKPDPTAKGVQCKYCKKQWNSLQLHRARAHLEGIPGLGIHPCPDAPAKLREELQKQTQEKEKRAKEKEDKKAALEKLKAERAREEESQQGAKRQLTMGHWSAKQTEALDVQFAKIIYNSGPSPPPLSLSFQAISCTCSSLSLVFTLTVVYSNWASMAALLFTGRLVGRHAGLLTFAITCSLALLLKPGEGW